MRSFLPRPRPRLHASVFHPGRPPLVNLFIFLPLWLTTDFLKRRAGPPAAAAALVNGNAVGDWLVVRVFRFVKNLRVKGTGRLSQLRPAEDE